MGQKIQEKITGNRRLYPSLIKSVLGRIQLPVDFNSERNVWKALEPKKVLLFRGQQISHPHPSIDRYIILLSDVK